ncbi:hypothetical protein CYMTET_11745 [Cymbomonas tetramitiformis]|uniref:Uncharacterized protein n=1 Tax=Cymbomonas tetramitiformis TaxID=36881 RepID=A0AAE0LCV2_9CHLO|nr:hypothetical protein CYMTET_11745 [Cymbomonas tetramitiformis]
MEKLIDPFSIAADCLDAAVDTLLDDEKRPITDDDSVLVKTLDACMDPMAEMKKEVRKLKRGHGFTPRVEKDIKDSDDTAASARPPIYSP